MRRLLLTLTLFLLLPGSASAAWQWPVSGDVITPYRNGGNPYAAGQHRGIDIEAPAGAAVVAAAAGEVRFAGTAGSSGLTVSVRTGEGYDTSYLHLSSLSVRAGGRVAAGDRLGAVGTTGTRSAAAPHLHFGVRTAGSQHGYHDPLRFLPPPPLASSPPAAPPAAAPEPEPAPPAAAPAPVAVPLPGAAPRRQAAAVDRRAPRPAPLDRRAPRVVLDRRAPEPASVDRRAPLHESTTRAGVPAPAARAGRALASPRTGRSPAAGMPVDLDAGRTSDARPLEPALGRGEARAEQGPDIGWALACAGLLLAAGLLGLTEDGRRSTRRVGSAVARLIPSKDPA